MYCGFINDSIFKKQTSVRIADTRYDQCVIDRQMGNYFHTEMVVADPRSERLLLGGKLVVGDISFHYDGNRHLEEGDMLNSLGDEDLKILFNVMEMVYLANGADEAELNSTLMSSAQTSGIYVPNTLKLSRVSVEAQAFNVGGADRKILMPTYFQVDVTFAAHDQQTLRIFLDRSAFMLDYPFSTITNTVYPCAPEYILDPTQIEGTIDALIKSTSHSLDDLDGSIKPEDHSGLLTYYTKYITKNVNKTTSTRMLPFGVLYQGAKPSSLMIREAIREDLLDEGIASEGIWEQILPDLFVTAQFFMIPTWDNYTLRPMGAIYPSIINVEKLKESIPTLFPHLDVSYLKQHQELITCGQSDLFITTIPDPLNKDEFSILGKHPSYSLHMSQEGSGFLSQDPITRDFNIRFNKCMATACGLEAPDGIITQEIDDLTWHSFTAAKTEYHVLSKSSYMKFFNIME